ncbi:hypothetical protein V6R21_05805 [Limibacter armeniacum]|uniref:hypothetical protein n=1 Tax=Limibacter armeniacum TaxID=466084 RepID=UPI002FE64C6A
MLMPGFYLFELSAEVFSGEFLFRVAGYVDGDDPETGYRGGFALHTVEVQQPCGEWLNVTDLVERLGLITEITEAFYDLHI